MVMTESRVGNTVITLTPHLSANWPETKRFLWCLGTAVFLVAAGCLVAGAWLVLPFAGLEFVLVVWFMHRVCFRLTYLYQSIQIEPGRVVVRQGARRPEREWVLDRPAVHVHIIKPVNDFDILRVSLQDDHTYLPVGEFLNGAGREAARRALRGAGLTETSDRWWLP